MTDTGPPAFARLADRALIRLSGPDWRSFLQGLVTQDVEAMGEGETRYAALLTPQGRLLYDLFVSADADGAWLDVAAETRDALLARLRMYRLRAKVALDAAECAVMALWGRALWGGEAAAPAPWRRDPRLSALGWRGIDAALPKGAAASDAAAYDRHRLSLGVGDVDRDAMADRLYALEANLDLLNAVDFHKGCYVGQETTSRMKRRSVVKSRLLPLRFEGPAPGPGAEVLAGELRAGVVHSGVAGLALALMRLDRAAGAELAVDGRPVTLDTPAWAVGAVREATAERV